MMPRPLIRIGDPREGFKRLVNAAFRGSERLSTTWAGRSLVNNRDALLWALGATNAYPQPGHGLLRDNRHYQPPAPTQRPTPDRTPPAATGRQQTGPVAGRDTPGKPRRGMVRERLDKAITAGPPRGGTWGVRELARAVGCAPSTAHGALQRHKHTRDGRQSPKPRPSRRKREQEMTGPGGR